MTTLNDLAESLRCNMFATRPTVKEAYEYATRVVEGLVKSEQIYVYTALHVLMNAISDEITRHTH